METVTIKLQEETAREIERLTQEFHYGTKTELIRDAIRAKIKQLTKEREVSEFAKKLAKHKGAAKVHLSDERLEEIREEVFSEMCKERGIKLD